jgi:hypothetical protein
VEEICKGICAAVTTTWISFIFQELRNIWHLIYTLLLSRFQNSKITRNPLKMKTSNSFNTWML